MTLEIKRYYTRGIGYRSLEDKECSTPAHEITDADAEQFISLLQAMGARRHETKTQVFFDIVSDSNHSTEYIFRR